MKNSKNHGVTRRIATGALAATVLLGSAGALSNVVRKNITAEYMGIRLVVDGDRVIPKDAQGRTVEPFASNGTTYLPVRAISQALGEKVYWDGETRTVYVGLVPGDGEDWMKRLPPYEVGGGQYTGHDQYGRLSGVYDGADPEHYFTVAGTKQISGVALIGNHYAGKDEYRGYALYNCGAEYSSVAFDIGHIDGTSQRDATLKIYLDEQEAASYELKWNAAPQHIEIPLNYAIGMRLELSRGDTQAENSCFGYYNVEFRK